MTNKSDTLARVAAIVEINARTLTIAASALVDMAEPALANDLMRAAKIVQESADLIRQVNGSPLPPIRY